jgi:hypothetical protein
MQFTQAAQRIAADLDRLGLPFALIGGFAVSIRTEPRFTQDIDLAVAAHDDAAAERVVRELTGQGYGLVAIVEQEATERLATVRMQMPDGPWIVDLLFASSGVEPEIAAAAEPIEIVPGVRMSVARIGHLIALKLLARDDESRPQDAVDLHALASVATGEDLALAREAVDLITARGYARGRDLGEALTALR